MARSVIGWDIGGAHVKAARIENGQVVAVRQAPCPLWRNLDRLKSVLADLTDGLGRADWHAVTMTGELSDIFPDRSAGVAAITDTVADALAPARFALYAGRAGFVDPATHGSNMSDIASANWHASASVVARYGQDALFADMGSTTTDLIPVDGGRVAAVGYTDAERLASGELAYTGLTRAFLMALAPRAPVGGSWTQLACEHFATTADVYRILGTLDEAADQMPSADGRAKTLAASRARIARMVGRDAADAPDRVWHDLAAWFAEMQLRQLHDSALLVLSHGSLAQDAPIIGAGIGICILQSLATRLGRRYLTFADLMPTATAREWIDRCAPAVAVGLLADAQLAAA